MTYNRDSKFFAADVYLYLLYSLYAAMSTATKSIKRNKQLIAHSASTANVQSLLSELFSCYRCSGSVRVLFRIDLSNLSKRRCTRPR